MNGWLTRLEDWADHNDYGYPAGLLCYGGFAAALLAESFIPLPIWWWLAAPLLVIAFALCWWFG